MPPPTSSTPPRPKTPLPSQPQPTPDHHLSTFRHRLSHHSYPPDCPPLSVRWFYAVDVPKRKPFEAAKAAGISIATSTDAPLSTDSKVAAAAAAAAVGEKDKSGDLAKAEKEKERKMPQKFVPFAPEDSRSIEATYGKLVEEEEGVEEGAYLSGTLSEGKEVKVPVNEDYLFDVDIRRRELAPVYWLGPVYDVRRGTWFYQEGSSLRPCDENLATQLEEGYLKLKPFRQQQQQAGLRPKTPVSSNTATPRSESPAAGAPASGSVGGGVGTSTSSTPQQQQSWRLFGAHMNSFVVFADANTAWLLTDDFYGKLSATVWQRITAGANMGGVKLVRGYSEPGSEKAAKDKPKEHSKTPPPAGKKLQALTDAAAKRKSAPPPPTVFDEPPSLDDIDNRRPSLSGRRTSRETARAALERKLSTYGPDRETTAAAILEEEMKTDYLADNTQEDPGREISHLILVTHGIGQKLGMRMESVNFVHDVNVLRKNLKTVYSESPELLALNKESELPEEARKNSRLQVLPVCWRHLVDFPQQSLRTNRGIRAPDETDLSSYTPDEEQTAYEEAYPSLEDITVEGVPTVRNLMTDLALDVLLYQSETYREHIISTVLTECNRIYSLFLQRNPRFKGRVSFIGHSLGSAIMFDILCRQPFPSSTNPSTSPLALQFEVENFYTLGSPIGLFEMLAGRTISARDPTTASPPESAYPTSSPLVKQLFNIFHPSDPIAYRLEPLISKPMAKLKPHPLPYTKRSLFGANGPVSGLGQTVSRNITGLWTSLSTGIASSIITRGLGLDTPGASTQQHEVVPEGEVLGEIRTGEKVKTPGDSLFEGFVGRGMGEGMVKREMEKVRRLNRGGRVDWAIQEGAWEVSLIASVASHLSYWGDEDVGRVVVRESLGGGSKERASGL